MQPKFDHSGLVQPEQILTAMAKVYAGCQSYRDHGQVSTQFFRDTRPPRTEEKPFVTRFVRPDRFWFEYRHALWPSPPTDRTGVAGRGSTIRSWDFWNGRERVKSEQSLIEVLRSLGGVSSRVSWVVPFLLLPGWGGGAPWGLLELTRLDDGWMDGADCYRLRGRFPTTPGHEELCRREVRRVLNEEWQAEVDPEVFWVEKYRLLLRRIDSSTRFRGFCAQWAVTYHPEINVSISESELIRYGCVRHEG